MEKLFLKLISAGIIIFGIFLVIKPNIVIGKLKNFYNKYPIVRYAGEKQLTSRPQFIIIFGIIVILVGILLIISLF